MKKTCFTYLYVLCRLSRLLKGLFTFLTGKSFTPRSHKHDLFLSRSLRAQHSTAQHTSDGIIGTKNSFFAESTIGRISSGTQLRGTLKTVGRSRRRKYIKQKKISNTRPWARTHFCQWIFYHVFSSVRKKQRVWVKKRLKMRVKYSWPK